MKTWLLWICVGLEFTVCGCVKPIPDPPRNLVEYQLLQQTYPQEYPAHTIVQLNTQRVLDGTLDEAQRLGSLELAVHLAGGRGDLPEQLSAMVSQPDCPTRLHRKIMTYLVNRGRGGMSREDIVRLLPQSVPGRHRTGMLKWLANNPMPQVLAEVVKIWARERPGGPDEKLFRRTVARTGGKDWADTLLVALNAEGFRARGSALSVLVGRMDHRQLIHRFQRMIPRTLAVRAIQAFGERFDYLPANGQELLTCVSLWNSSRGTLDDAARLTARWTSDYDPAYKFNVRDFHLLSGLARNPLRQQHRRNKLVKNLTRRLRKRRHLAGVGGEFQKQVQRLTLVDLWNLTVLSEMIERPRVQLSLRILTDRLRANVKSPRSGLILYENGRAVAKLYPQASDAAGPPGDYIPSRAIQRAGRNAVCHLHTRFEKTYNGDRAAPSKRELMAAKQTNFYGLVLCSIDSGTFSTFYYTPNGVIISLGMFPFGK